MNNFDESYFQVDTDTGDLICKHVPRYPVLVLFHQPACTHCPAAINVFYSLAQTERRIALGLVNVAQKGGVLVRRTSRSNFPLKYVPYLVLFINGVAVGAYKQKLTLDGLREFIGQSLAQGPARDRFSARQQPDEGVKPQPPVEASSGATTTLGVPVCDDDDVCYLVYDDAYSKSSNPK